MFDLQKMNLSESDIAAPMTFDPVWLSKDRDATNILTVKERLN